MYYIDIRPNIVVIGFSFVTVICFFCLVIKDNFRLQGDHLLGKSYSFI